MKLYATTTSERASKGQGGNQRVDVVITRENQSPIIAVLCQVENDGKQAHCRIIAGGEEIYNQHIELSKGKKQKDECDGKHDTCEDIVKCPDCSKALDRM